MNSLLSLTQPKPWFILILGLLVSTVVVSQSNDLVVIDSDYAQQQEVLNSIQADVPVLIVNSSANPFKTIREYLEGHPGIIAVHLFAEASYNSFHLGGTIYTSDEVANENELSMLEGLYKGDNIQLLIYNCNLGSNEEGLELLQQLGNRAYFNVAVPTTCTSVFGSEILFDHTTLNQPTHTSILQ